MDKPLPTFPLDFNFQTFTKELSNDIEKRQNILVEKEMDRIYNFVMAYKNYEHHYNNKSITFQFNTELNEQSKKYILGEIMKRFPHVTYTTGSYNITLVLEL